MSLKAIVWIEREDGTVVLKYDAIILQSGAALVWRAHSPYAIIDLEHRLELDGFTFYVDVSPITAERPMSGTNPNLLPPAVSAVRECLVELIRLLDEPRQECNAWADDWMKRWDQSLSVLLNQVTTFPPDAVHDEVLHKIARYKQ